MDIVSYFRYLLALIFVLGLMGVVAWCFNYLSQKNFFRSLTGQRRRLTIKETLTLDPKTKIILLGADDQEHLILVGHESHLLLSSAPLKQATVFSLREMQG